MKLFCAGEQIFCEFFALMGAEYSVCRDGNEAADALTARGKKDELIIVSESILASECLSLKKIINDPQRFIITIPVTTETTQ